LRIANPAKGETILISGTVLAHNFEREGAAMQRRSFRGQGLTKEGTPRWNARSEDGQELDRIIKKMIKEGTITENTEYTEVILGHPQFDVYSTDTMRSAVRRHSANHGVKLLAKGTYSLSYTRNIT
jgi:hypothetical protein